MTAPDAPREALKLTLPPASDDDKQRGWTLSYEFLRQLADSDAVRGWGVGMEGVEAVLLTVADLGQPAERRDDTAELVAALGLAKAAMHRVMNTRLDHDPAAFIGLAKAHEQASAALARVKEQR